MIKVGIVGARGLSVVQAIKAMPEEAKVTAMCDLDEEALQKAKEAINDPELQTYRIYNDMLEKADIDAVHTIEVLSFRSPWSKHSLLGELKNNVAHYTVMERDGEIVGYCGLWVLFEEAHITNIAILPAYRGNGYGKQLLHAAMRVAASFGAEMMTLEVRESNAVAQRMYGDMDFVQQGFRKRYYTDTGEGALLLWNRNILKTIKNNTCLTDAYLLESETFKKGEGET